LTFLYDMIKLSQSPTVLHQFSVVHMTKTIEAWR